MPFYIYKCRRCGYEKERYCSLKDFVEQEECVCGGSMHIKILSPYVIAHNTQYSKVLGIDTANKSQVSEMKMRYHDRTGGHLVSIGDAKIEEAVSKPKDLSYRYEEAAREVIRDCAI